MRARNQQAKAMSIKKKKLNICYLKWEVKKYTGTCEITGYYRE